MNHLGSKVLETERLILRPFTMDDAHAMYTNWCGDPEVTKFMRFAAYQSEQEAVDILKLWTAEYSNPARYHWCIVSKEIGQPIGSIGMPTLSENDSRGEIGYCMGRAWWGKGLMTEAAAAMVRFLFEEVAVNRIEAGHSVNNPASGGVMRNLGMTQYGTAHQHYICNLGPQDADLYELLRETYLANQARNF